MRADKVREIDNAELQRQSKDIQEQSFRLRFQLTMGQTDGLKKLRAIKKDRARMLTILRDRELHPGHRAGTCGQERRRKESRPWPQRTQAAKAGNKNEKIGQVVSAKMQKTIVVEVTRRVPHPVYKRIINKRNKFYAHDEQQSRPSRRCGEDHRVPAHEQAQALAAGRSAAQGRASGGGTRVRWIWK